MAVVIEQNGPLAYDDTSPISYFWPGRVEGDLYVLFATIGNTGNGDITNPEAHWNLGQRTLQGSSLTTLFYWWIGTASEPVSKSITYNGRLLIQIKRFSGFDSGDPIGDIQEAKCDNCQNLNSPEITTTADNSLLFWMCQAQVSNITSSYPPSGYTGIADEDRTNYHQWFYKNVPSASTISASDFTITINSTIRDQTIQGLVVNASSSAFKSKIYIMS